MNYEMIVGIYFLTFSADTWCTIINTPHAETVALK